MIKYIKEGPKKSTMITIFIILFIASFFFSVGNGAVKINPLQIIKSILYEKDTVKYQIIWNVRLPRTIVAALVGICLSLSGAILQGIMRNPLAGPNIIGVSSGGGFFALIILIIFPKYYYLVPIGAFIGALSATLFIYSLAWKEGVLPTRLVLAGVAVSSLFSAGTNGLMTFFPDRVHGVLGFMVGGLSAITWKDVRIILPYAVLGTILILFLPDKLNILMLGDEVATGLGVKVERTRFVFIIISSLLAGAAVSVVGLLGFVGLIVPHMTRLFIGSDYRYLFPGTIFFGSSIVMICDTLSRILFAPMEIPVGIIMSALGAPFFLYLLRKKEAMK
ncbi:ferrichrome ABC transporter [Tissierella sp. P1]|jgi:iron complex transport system permease protein|uniref:FecCD family ABC transporter permease n=1 Tax=Tissierella TaxID=41273 RepID=UPI000BA01DDA|nr:iron ABC transporter permease [Tissierella sp. P1]MDU5081048.1 iron ABC transporter permease [Bacillota bacterium]OZV12516.1 ferrichrome ABC transporter [Tissierella sp. P1]